MIKIATKLSKCSCDQVYQILIDEELHSQLINDKVRIDAKIGGRYDTFEGYAVGKILELKANQLIKVT